MRQPYLCSTLIWLETLEKIYFSYSFSYYFFYQHHWFIMSLKATKKAKKELFNEVSKEKWLDLAISEYYIAIAMFKKISVILLAKMYDLVPFILQ